MQTPSKLPTASVLGRSRHLPIIFFFTDSLPNDTSRVGKGQVLWGSALVPQTHYHTCIVKVLVPNLEKDNLLYGTVVQQKKHTNKYENLFPKM